MDPFLNVKIVFTGLGDRINGSHYLRSSFVRMQMNSLKPHLKEIIPFAITNTSSISGILRNSLELRKFLNNTQPDLVHAHYGSTTALITLLASCRKYPLIVSFCGNDLISYSSPDIMESSRVFLATLISKFCSRFTDLIIVKSNNLFDSLPVSVQSKVHILPNGVDLKHFRPISQIESRDKLRLNSGNPIVIFSKTKGSETVKCPQLAYDTFSLLQKKLSNSMFLEIGNESYENMPLYLNAADVLILTSLCEGSPNIIKEAMACNLPVVSVDCGDVRDRLKNVSPGGVFNRDPQTLADQIESILANNNRSDGRIELEKQCLSIDDVAIKLIRIFQEFLSKNPRYSRGQ